MNTVPVQKALEMGLHEGRIRAATKNQLDSTGRPYQSVEALVEAVLDGQYNEEQAGDEDETNQSSSTIVQEVSRILDTIFNPRASSSSMSQDDEPVQDIDHNTQRVQIPENAQQQDDNHDTENVEKIETTETVAAENSVQEPVETMETQQLSLEEENRKLKDARLCKICMVDEVGVVFLPCGHLGTLDVVSIDFDDEIHFDFFFLSYSYMLSMCYGRIGLPTLSPIDQSVRQNVSFLKQSHIV